MSVNPSHLRPGNWIHCKGSSHYGIVTGDLLALLEKEEKMREKFEGIELTGELLEAAGFIKNGFHQHELSLPKTYSCVDRVIYFAGNYLYLEEPSQRRVNSDLIALWNKDMMGKFYIHQLQNIFLDLTGFELPLPESAKRINLAVEK